MADEIIGESTAPDIKVFRHGLTKVLNTDGYVGKVLNSNIFHVAALTSLVPLSYAGCKSEKFAKILSVMMIVYIIVIVFLMIGYSNDNAAASNLGVLGLVIGLILIPTTLFVLGSSYYFTYMEWKK